MANGSRRHSDSCHVTTLSVVTDRAKEILQANPCWVLSEDREHKNFDKGTYTRDITLSDRSGNPKAVLRLENDFFLDDLVEKFPERYDPSDYPGHHDDTKNI